MSQGFFGEGLPVARRQLRRVPQIMKQHERFPVARPFRGMVAACVLAVAGLSACDYDALNTAASVAAIAAGAAAGRDELPADAVVTVEVIGEAPAGGSRSAEGSVRVRPVSGGPARELSVGESATLRYAPGTELALQRVDGNQDVVSSWGGECAGAAGNECRLFVAGSLRVVARFVVPHATFRMAHEGAAGGTLAVVHGGESVSVGAGDVAVFDPGASVRLVADPGVGARAVWGGGPCESATGNECAFFAAVAAEVSVGFVRTRTLGLSLSLAGASQAGHAVEVTHVAEAAARLRNAGAPVESTPTVSVWRLSSAGVAGLPDAAFSSPEPGTYLLEWPVDVGDRLAFRSVVAAPDVNSWGGACGQTLRDQDCELVVDDPDPPEVSARPMAVSSVLGSVRTLTVTGTHEDGDFPSGVVATIMLSGARERTACVFRRNSNEDCRPMPTVGAAVALSAVVTGSPPAGSAASALLRWETDPPGACAPGAGADGPCAFEMPASPLAVTAVFASFPDLTVAIDGAGGSVRAGQQVVTATARVRATDGEVVVLVAQAGPGAVFLGWSGACAGRERICEATAGAVTATAAFAPAATLSLRGRSPAGAVTAHVTDRIGEFSLPLFVGPNRVAEGSTVTLTAAGLTGDGPTVFERWATGSDCADDDATNSVCGPFPATDRLIDAEFAAARWLDLASLARRVSGSDPPDAGAVRVEVKSAAFAVARTSTLAAGPQGGRLRMPVPVDARVRLEADPDAPDALFLDWAREGIDCQDSPPVTSPDCRFTMPDQDLAATATYVSRAPTVTLSFSGAGAGSVTATVSLPPTSAFYPSPDSAVLAPAVFGAGISLTATAGEGSLFSGWGEQCPAATGSVCTLSADSSHDLTAMFIAAAEIDLFVDSGGDTSATVDVAVDGVPSGRYGPGRHRIQVPRPPASMMDSTVTLTATPSEGSLFSDWSGCAPLEGDPRSCAATTPPAGQALSLSARFSRDLRAVTVAVSGAGAALRGDVPIASEDTPSVTFQALPDATVALAASATAGAVFWRWEGDVCPGVSELGCSFSPGQVPGSALAVTAVFRPPAVALSVLGASGVEVAVSGAVSGDGAYAPGAPATIESVPDASVALSVPEADRGAFVRWEVTASSGGDVGSGGCSADDMPWQCTLTTGNGLGWRPLRVDAVFRTVYRIEITAGSGGVVRWAFDDNGSVSGEVAAGSLSAVTVPSTAPSLSLFTEAESGHLFATWDVGGPCAAQALMASCSFRPRGDDAVSASFAAAVGVSVTARGLGSLFYPGGEVVGTDRNATETATFQVPAGALVDLNAVAAPGELFTHWSGACAGTAGASCTVTAPGAGVSATAHFARAVELEVSTRGNAPRRRLSMSVEEPGATTTAPGETLNLSLGRADEVRVLPAGSTVTLRAQDLAGNVVFGRDAGDAGSRFLGWERDGRCVVVVSAPRVCKLAVADVEAVTATASFAGLLTVSIERGAGDGAATVSWTASFTGEGADPGFPEGFANSAEVLLGPSAQASARLAVPVPGRLAMSVSPSGTVFAYADVAVAAPLVGDPGCTAPALPGGPSSCVFSVTAPAAAAGYAALAPVRLPLSEALGVALRANGPGRIGAALPPGASDPDAGDPGSVSPPPSERTLFAPRGSLLTLTAVPDGDAAFLRWSAGACAASDGAISPQQAARAECAFVVGDGVGEQVAEFAAGLAAPVSVVVPGGEADALTGASLSYRVSHPDDEVDLALYEGSLALADSPPGSFTALPGARVELRLESGAKTVVPPASTAVSVHVVPDGGTERELVACGPDADCAFSVPTDASELRVQVSVRYGHTVELRLVGSGRAGYSVSGGGPSGALQSPSPRLALFQGLHGANLSVTANAPAAGVVFSGFSGCAPDPNDGMACSLALLGGDVEMAEVTAVTVSYTSLRNLQLIPGSTVGRVSWSWMLQSTGDSGDWMLRDGVLDLPVPNGARVTLTALEDPAWNFAGWAGSACEAAEDGGALCEFGMDASVTALTANFDAVPELRVGIYAGGMDGEVDWSWSAGTDGDSGMLDHPGDSTTSVRVPTGSDISLTARPTDAGAVLAGWLFPVSEFAGADAVPDCLRARVPGPSCAFELTPALLAAAADGGAPLVQAWFARPATVTFVAVGASNLASGSSWVYAAPGVQASAAFRSPSVITLGAEAPAVAGASIVASLLPGPVDLVFGVSLSGSPDDNLCPPPVGAARGVPASCPLTVPDAGATWSVETAPAFTVALSARSSAADPGIGSIGYQVTGAAASECINPLVNGDYSVVADLLAACGGGLLVAADSSVSVSAKALDGSFLGRWEWSGGGIASPCSGTTSPCVFTGLSADASLAAVFSSELSRVMAFSVSRTTALSTSDPRPRGGVSFTLGGTATDLLSPDDSVDDPDEVGDAFRVAASIPSGGAAALNLRFQPAAGFAYIGVYGPDAGLCAYRPVAAGDPGTCLASVGGSTSALSWHVGFIPTNEANMLSAGPSAGFPGAAGTVTGSATASSGHPAFSANFATPSTVALTRRGGEVSFQATAAATSVFDRWESSHFTGCTGNALGLINPECAGSLDVGVDRWLRAVFLPLRELRLGIIFLAPPAAAVSVAATATTSERRGPMVAGALQGDTATISDGQGRAVALSVAWPPERLDFDRWDLGGLACDMEESTTERDSARCVLTLGGADTDATAEFTPRWQLTVSPHAGQGGSGSVSASFVGGRVVFQQGSETTTFRHAAALTLAPAPASADDRFVGWDSGGVCGPADRGECMLALTADTAVTARFEPLFDFTVFAGDHGMVFAEIAGAAAERVDAGSSEVFRVTVLDTATLTATPEDGYAFDVWDTDGPCVASGHVCGIGVGSFGAGVAVTASFSPQSLSLLVSAMAGGSVDVRVGAGSTETVASGSMEVPFAFTVESMVTLTAEPGTGYAFDGWNDGGPCASQRESETCSISPGALTAGAAVTAAFSAQTLSLPVSALAGGSVRAQVGAPVESEELVGPGTTSEVSFTIETAVTLMAESGAGFAFDGWNGDGPCASQRESQTCSIAPGLDAFAANGQTVTASFSVAMLSLSVGATTSGSVDVRVGANPTATVTSSSPATPFPFTAALGLTLTAVASPGYEFDGWDAEGPCREEMSDSCSISAGTLTASTAVTALFSPQSLSLSVSAGPNGSVQARVDGVIHTDLTASLSFTVASAVTLTATATPGFAFDSWSGAPCSGQENVCSIKPGDLTASAAVTASFSVTMFSLSVSAGPNGSVRVQVGAPSNLDEVVEAGASSEVSFTAASAVTLTATATPDFGYYAFDSWSGTPCSGQENICSIRPGTLTADAAVMASFSPQSLALSVSATTGGSVEVQVGAPVNSVGVVEAGASSEVSFTVETTVTLTAVATPDSGYVFDGWDAEVPCNEEMGDTCSISPRTLIDGNAVVARFSITTLSLSVSATTGGSVGVQVDFPVVDGVVNPGASTEVSLTLASAVTLTATAASGYEFIGWDWGADLERLCRGASLTCSVSPGTLTAASSVTASFSDQSLSLSVSAETGGSVRVQVGAPSNLDEVVQAGATFVAQVTAESMVTLTSRPNPGYMFVGGGTVWDVLGPCGGRDNICSLAPPGDLTFDAAVTAVFEVRTLTLTAIATTGGSVLLQVDFPGSDPPDLTATPSTQKSQAFTVESTVTLTASAESSYEFASWDDEGPCSGEPAICSFSPGTLTDLLSVVTAGFTPRLFILEVTAGPNGSVLSQVDLPGDNDPNALTATPGFSVIQGFNVESTVTLMAQADTGYEFDGWDAVNAEIPCSEETGDTCSISPGTVTGGGPIAASFSLRTFFLRVRAMAGGSVWFRIEHSAAAVTTDDISHSVVQEIVVPNPTTSPMLAARDPFLTIESSMTLIAQPDTDEGYEFLEWNSDGPCGGELSSTCSFSTGTLTRADQGRTIAASFSMPPQTLSLSVSAMTGGSVQVEVGAPVNSDGTVEAGTSSEVSFTSESMLTLTAEADPAYEFDTWGAEGPCRGTNRTCVISAGALSGGEAVTASFKPALYQLTIRSMAGGSVRYRIEHSAAAAARTGSAVEQRTVGPEGMRGPFLTVESSIMLTAQPDTDAGYGFLSWNSDGLCREMGDICSISRGTITRHGQSVTASFAMPQTLSVSAGLNGSVQVQVGTLSAVTVGAGIEMPFPVPDDTPVLLRPAASSAEYAFSEWTLPSGVMCAGGAAAELAFPDADVGEEDCVLLAGSFESGASVEAVFGLPTYTLTVGVSAGENGQVNVLAGGVDADSADSETPTPFDLADGSSATLTAQPDTDYVFERWVVVGPASCFAGLNANPCRLTGITDDQQVTAVFAMETAIPDGVSWQGPGAVTRGGSLLTAVPYAPGALEGWGAPCSDSDELTCDVSSVMPGEDLPTAMFRPFVVDGIKSLAFGLGYPPNDARHHFKILFQTNMGGGYDRDPALDLGDLLPGSGQFRARAHLQVPVHMLPWGRGSYLTLACDASETNCVTATGGQLELEQADSVAATGYFKAPNPRRDAAFGSSGIFTSGVTYGGNVGSGTVYRAIALSADGATLAVGASLDLSTWTGTFSPGDADYQAALDSSTSTSLRGGAVTVYRRSSVGRWAVEAFIKPAATGSRFGFSVALSADGAALAVGQPINYSTWTGTFAPGDANYQAALDSHDSTAFHDGNGSNGAAYVYRRSSAGQWTLAAFIKQPAHERPEDRTDLDRFASAIALSADGATLAVGAPQEDSTWTGTFSRGDANYQAALDSNAGEYASHRFGNCADAAPAFCNGGAVTVYRHRNQNGVWAWEIESFIKPPVPGSSRHLFGFPGLALSGDGSLLAASLVHNDSTWTGAFAPGDANYQAALDGTGARNSGAVAVYRRLSTGQWAVEAFIKAPVVSADDLFPVSIALSSTGAVMVLGTHLEDSTWTGAFAPGDANYQAALDSGGARESGAAYVYHRSSAGQWTVAAFIKPPVASSEVYFGVSVDLSSNGVVMAVGSSGENSSFSGVAPSYAAALANDGLGVGGASNSGAAHVYRRSSAGQWTVEAFVKAPNSAPRDAFGSGVKLSGDGKTLAVTAHLEGGGATQPVSSGADASPDRDDPSVRQSGAVYLY